MKKQFYDGLVLISTILGTWFFKLVSGTIATGYFLLFPSRLKNSVRFYKALYPQRSMARHIWCSYRQYLGFTHVFLDRMRFLQDRLQEPVCEGKRHIETALQEKKGAVILMSHLGNWEIAAQLLNRMNPDMRVLLFMGRRQQEQIESLQKTQLIRNGIRVMAVENPATSAWNILEGVRFLRSGGVVSITGDRLWSGRERCVRVPFLGHFVRLPEVPYRLAMAARSPLIVFFCFREKGGVFRLTALNPIHLHAASGQSRANRVEAAARQYADFLETAVRRYPYQWFHFEPFIIPEND